MYTTETTKTVTSARDFSWYAKRISVMQPSEVLSRLGSQCALAVLSMRHRLGLTTTQANALDHRLSPFCRAQELQIPLWPLSQQPLDPEMAARVLGGELPQAGWNWRWTPEDPDIWHRAPDTGCLWPRQFFSSIPYRQGNPYGDARLMWEPARLQQLVVLGMVAAQGSASVREQAVGLMEAQFLSWGAANPLFTGIHYVSAMECGLRLMSVCHAFDLVRPWLRRPETVWPAVLRLVDGHASVIRQRTSLHSSLGNHTIAEAAALVYAGVLFPDMPQSTEWRAIGVLLLESESTHQILADGGGVEQGFPYLRFISDLYGLVAALLAHRSQPVPDSIQEALERSRSFLAAMRDSTGRLPSIGDGDSGYALAPALDFGQARQPCKTGLAVLEASGYSVLETHEGVPARLILDHGSLGMAPCYAHGHADALSVLFQAGGRDLLIDSGTYTYSGDQAWRRYFRGTRAHNTVVVDGLDQAVQETAFQWSSPYRAQLVSRGLGFYDETILIAQHDGYLGRCGVVHRRGILYWPPGLWVIIDRLTGSGEHELELNWHLGAAPIEDLDGFVLEDDKVGVRLTVTGGTVTLHRGETDPMIGWQSVSYGDKAPVHTIQATYRGPLPHEFVTCLVLRDDDASAQQAAVSSLKEAMHEAQPH